MQAELIIIMDILYLVFIPAIIALGLVTSYTDILFGKIRNRHILLAIIYVPIAYFFIIMFYVFSGTPMNFSYLVDLSINILIALFVAFIAWNFKVWSAADGKLFLAYACLVPLIAFSRTYFSYFPSFVLLINTFFPVFFFYAFRIIFNVIKNEKMGFLRKIDSKMIVYLILDIFWITWIPRIFNQFFNFNIGILGNIIFVLSFIFLIRKISTTWKLPVVFSSVRIIFDFYFIITYAFLSNFIIMSVILISVFIVVVFSSNIFSKTMKVENLKPGIILEDIIFKESGKYKRMSEMEAMTLIKDGVIKNDDILKVSQTGDGLDNDDIRRIITLKNKGKLDFTRINIIQTVPFSPFLFLGVLLTLIASGNFLLFFNIIG